MNREAMVQHMVSRLRAERDNLKRSFHNTEGIPTRHALLDGLLPPEVAESVSAGFMATREMRRMVTFRESKYTSKSLERAAAPVADATFAVQAPEVLREIEEITGIPSLLADPHLYAGGVSSMVYGDFLNPHIDNSHDSERTSYRRLNALYYVTPDWDARFGGSLELWDSEVRSCVEIPSLFNRLVIMETNRSSWHSVSRIRSQRVRQCVSNYYFTEASPGGHHYFHVTSFQGRPGEHLRRLISRPETLVRNLIRRVAKNGIGKRDLYGRVL